MSSSLEQLYEISIATGVLGLFALAIVCACGGFRGPDGKPKQKTVSDLLSPAPPNEGYSGL